MTQPLLRFIHISDTHIHPDPDYTKPYAWTTSYKGAQALVRQLNALPFTPDFILHTGDVAYDPDAEAYAACREILSVIKHPVYYVAGNHDESRALQQYLIGTAEPVMPLHYEFEMNGVQVVVADSNGPTTPPAGFMTDAQLEWLRTACQPDDPRPLVIATHHIMLPVGIPWLDDYMRTTNGEAFHAAILPARERIRGVFFGHVHQNLDTLRDGILYSSALSSWTQFMNWPDTTETTTDERAEPGYSVVMVYPNQTYIRRHRFPLPG